MVLEDEIDPPAPEGGQRNKGLLGFLRGRRRDWRGRRREAGRRGQRRPRIGTAISVLLARQGVEERA